MKINIISQPFDELDNTVNLGDKLIALLKVTKPAYQNIWMVSAFANQQAILKLFPYMKDAISRGANISITVGIDHNGTSLEALKEIMSLGSDAKVVHNKRVGNTFHPKIYLFENMDKKAELFIGSNNMTIGGLYTNYEVSTHITFEFPEDYENYKSIKKSLARILNPPDSIVQLLTDDLIENLRTRNQIPNEAEKKIATRSNSINSDSENAPENPFGSEIIGRPLTVSTIPTKIKTDAGIDFSPENYRLVWERKNLPASSVQKQKGNPTGGLRLTQAGWIVNDEVIDQTTYFRYDIFGSLKWRTGELRYNNQELAETEFQCRIIGKLNGIYELRISHKPSGEAGQGNYTTMLHWGVLADTIRDLNLVGKTFRLYAPHNKEDIFVIEIM